MTIRPLYILLVILCLASCGGKKIRGGKVIIRNDILDKEYNSFTVDKIVTSRGAKAYRKTLKPGEQVVLPFKHIRSLRFLRRYADHSKVYFVECDSKMNQEITLKLIDVHTNRMDACDLVKRGKMSRGGLVKWE